MENLNKQEFKSGYTLPQAYYCDEDIYKTDVEIIGNTQWQLIDHVSRIPNVGDYITFEFSNESIIVIRGKKGEINAFYNVCRHRGSRICLKHEGNTRALTCPYHAWSYDLEGKLRSAQHMPEDFVKDTKNLVPCHIGVAHGLIFLNLSKTTPPSFEEFIGRFEPYLSPYDLANTKVGARHSIPNAANWKLVVENFFECYHCKPSHSTYCSVHDELKLLAFGAGPGSGDSFAKEYMPTYEKWQAEQEADGKFTGMFSDGPQSAHFQQAGKMPIGRDNQTESLDGKPVAPVLGNQQGFDGSQTGCVFNPLSTLLISNDFAVIFRFTPRGPILTDAEAIWLVRGDAEEGKDYDVGRLTDVWKITLAEDKKITQDNQEGVLSSVYVPGPYSVQEQRIADFVEWYMSKLASHNKLTIKAA